jgi:hypothetical protein
VDRKLLWVEETVSEGGRGIRVYRATQQGMDLHREWLLRPVDPATIGNDLGMHLMRFAMMEALDKSEVAAFLTSLAAALDGFVSGMESYLATQEQWDSWFGTSAVRHGIAIHRASLEWAREALAGLDMTASDGDATSRR